MPTFSYHKIYVHDLTLDWPNEKSQSCQLTLDYLGEKDDGVKELLEGDPSVSVPIDDVEHLENEDILLAHAQSRRKLPLGQRRAHHHDHVTRHVLKLQQQEQKLLQYVATLAVSRRQQMSH